MNNQTIYVVSLLTPCGNMYVPYTHKEFTNYRDAAAYKQHMTAKGHVCKFETIG